jgi:hypothetical protein
MTRPEQSGRVIRFDVKRGLAQSLCALAEQYVPALRIFVAIFASLG